jgi:hypothetical protein
MKVRLLLAGLIVGAACDGPMTGHPPQPGSLSLDRHRTVMDQLTRDPARLEGVLCYHMLPGKFGSTPCITDSSGLHCAQNSVFDHQENKPQILARWCGNSMTNQELKFPVSNVTRVWQSGTR